MSESAPSATQPKRSFSVSSAVSNTSTLFRTSTHTPLDEIKLSHVLNGETCPPIGFTDFASFVTHKEFTTENLLFVIWFRSYQARWNALPDAVRLGIPIPSTRLRDRYAPFAYLDKAIAEGMVQSRNSSLDVRQNTPPRKAVPKIEYPDVDGGHEWKRCGWTIDGQMACQCGDVSHKHPATGATAGGSKWSNLLGHGAPPPTAVDPDRMRSILQQTSIHPPLPPVGTVLIQPNAQEMRQEAERAFATFLRKGGSRELGISDELRQFAKDCLKRSTAPDCFLPIYEEIYQAVESQSLPHFLSMAKTNINRPKQLFWYYVGVTDVLIGIIIFVLISILAHQHNFGYRLLRLPSAIFTSFGAMQFYSASRGFCTQVWGRTSRQIRPWEMDEVEPEIASSRSLDEEAAIEVLEPGIQRSSRGTTPCPEGEGDDLEKQEIVTPPVGMHEDVEIELGEEVHPLADLSGHGFSLDSETEKETPSSLAVQHSQDIEMLSDAARARLAIRRSTIKAPAPDLAFPIVDNSPTPIQISQFDREISPFGEPEPPISAAGIISAHEPGAGPLPRHLPRSLSQSPESPATSTVPALDLGALLGRFRRAEPTDPTSYKASEKTREKKTKIFGPEKLVEDPRVQALMKSIIRDILIVGAVAAVVTIALCFAVPMAGLA